jgi:peroxiredoxin
VNALVPVAPIVLSIAVACAAYAYGQWRGSHAEKPQMAGMGDAAPVAAGIGGGPQEMDLAPDFELADAHGGTVKLSAIDKQGPVLVIFYLGYNCPRCVGHLQEIEGKLDAIRAAGAQVVAISPDSVEKLKNSAETFGDFPFPLLADPDMKTAGAYGLVYARDTMFHGCYIVDKEGRVAFAMKSSHPYDNVDALVAMLRGMR